jgi:hypothetical protein
MWLYTVDNNTWTKLNETDIVPQLPGRAANYDGYPGARLGPIGWVNGTDLILFGGMAFNSSMSF